MFAARRNINLFNLYYVYKHACAHKIYDVKPIVQSTCVNTSHMHDTLQKHVCMSGMYMPNLVSVYSVPWHAS